MDVFSRTGNARLEMARAIDNGFRNYLTESVSNPLLHAELCALNPYEFKLRFKGVFRKSVQDQFGIVLLETAADLDEAAVVARRWVDLKWAKRHPGVTPSQYIDAYCPPTPPTDDELNEHWEYEVASDERYMRKHHEGSARTRKGSLEELGIRNPALTDVLRRG